MITDQIKLTEEHLGVIPCLTDEQKYLINILQVEHSYNIGLSHREENNQLHPSRLCQRPVHFLLSISYEENYFVNLLPLWFSPEL